MASNFIQEIDHFLFPAYYIPAESPIALNNSQVQASRIVEMNGKTAGVPFGSVYPENGIFHGLKSRIMLPESNVPSSEIQKSRKHNSRKRHKYAN